MEEDSSDSYGSSFSIHLSDLESDVGSEEARPVPKSPVNETLRAQRESIRNQVRQSFSQEGSDLRPAVEEKIESQEALLRRLKESLWRRDATVMRLSKQLRKLPTRTVQHYGEKAVLEVCDTLRSEDFYATFTQWSGKVKFHEALAHPAAASVALTLARFARDAANATFLPRSGAIEYTNEFINRCSESMLQTLPWKELPVRDFDLHIDALRREVFGALYKNLFWFDDYVEARDRRLGFKIEAMQVWAGTISTCWSDFPPLNISENVYKASAGEIGMMSQCVTPVEKATCLTRCHRILAATAQDTFGISDLYQLAALIMMILQENISHLLLNLVFLKRFETALQDPTAKTMLVNLEAAVNAIEGIDAARLLQNGPRPLLASYILQKESQGLFSIIFG